MKIYLASNVASKARIANVARKLRALGHEITSTWFEQADGQMYPQALDKGVEYSFRDIDEIKAADTLIIDTIETSTTGGRDVELGIAIALHKATWRVGPARNIFHTICHWQLDDWSEAITEIVRLEGLGPEAGVRVGDGAGRDGGQDVLEPGVGRSDAAAMGGAPYQGGS